MICIGCTRVYLFFDESGGVDDRHACLFVTGLRCDPDLATVFIKAERRRFSAARSGKPPQESKGSQLDAGDHFAILSRLPTGTRAETVYLTRPDAGHAWALKEYGEPALHRRMIVRIVAQFAREGDFVNARTIDHGRDPKRARNAMSQKLRQGWNRPVRVSFRRSEDVAGVQTADLVANACYRHVPRQGPFDGPFRRFERAPGPSVGPLDLDDGLPHWLREK